MADSQSVSAALPVAEEDLAQVEDFTREPFVHEDEDPAAVLAPGQPRRRAFDEALKEIEAGRENPSIALQQEFALILGAEALLQPQEAHPADGTLPFTPQV